MIVEAQAGEGIQQDNMPFASRPVFRLSPTAVFK